MFNLLITYAQGDWDATHYEYQISRVINGYTEPSLRQRLAVLTDPEIEEIKTYPCLFVYETNPTNKMPARIGWITGIRKRQSSVQITYKFDPSFAPISHEAIERLAWELDIQQVELYNTHWAVKNVDLLSVFTEARLIDRNEVQKLSTTVRVSAEPTINEIPVRPTVFKIPDFPVENDLVSIMMPFHPKFDDVSASIREECEAIGLRCKRADDIWGETELIQDIFSLIYRSKVVICDFTDRNPNVFYEAGIAHTLGRPVIPISQSESDVPADLRHHRYAFYLNNLEGRQKLRSLINPRLRTLTGR